MPTHVLRQHESIHTLASRYGLPAETIWNHAQNNALKESRKKPGVLLPGDEVFIPVVRAAEFSASAGQRHRFELKTAMVDWSVQFIEPSGPRANWTYEARVDGKLFEGQLDGDGKLKLSIPAKSANIEVKLTPPDDAVEDDDGHERFIEQHRFRLHGLDPADTPSGVRQRLRAMGVCLSGPRDTWDPSLKAAVRHFQKTNGLDTTGEVDSSTRSKLEAVFGT